jgi:hypothetical protein
MQARNVEYSKNEDLGDFKIPAKVSKVKDFRNFWRDFQRILKNRGVFLCSLRLELITSTQKRMLRCVAIRLNWETTENRLIIGDSRDT